MLLINIKSSYDSNFEENQRFAMGLLYVRKEGTYVFVVYGEYLELYYDEYSEKYLL